MKWLVVDDDSVSRTGLAALLGQWESGVTVLETDDAGCGLRLTRENPDLAAVIVDLSASGVRGVASLQDFIQPALQVPVVVVSFSEKPEDAVYALTRGARGYLPKSASPHTIQSALRLVLGGDVYVPPLLLRGERATGAAKACVQPGPAQNALTTRQRMVLQLLCRGLSNKAICHRLQLSEKTIKAHVSGIFKVLQVANRTQATRAALDAGLISWDAGQASNEDEHAACGLSAL